MEQGFLDGMNGLTSGLSGIFGQGGWIFAGLLCFAFGFVLVSNWLRWKRRAVEMTGTVIGTRRHGKFFYPVYNYKFPDDDTLMEATSDSGTTDATGIETGREVKLLVVRDAPDTAHEAGGVPWHLLGLALVAGGVFCFYRAMTEYPVTEMTGLLAVAMIIYFLNKSRRIMGSGKQRKTIKAYQQMQWEIMSEKPVESADRLRADPALATRLETAKQMQGIIGAVFTVAGLGLAVYCLYLSAAKIELLIDGTRAQGKVTELSKEYVTGKFSGDRYFPVVRFQDKDSHEFTFKDAAGSIAPAYEEGDEVGVIYLGKDPQATATIDHGMEDWLLPGFACLMGLLFLAKGLSMIPRRRDEVR